MPRRAASSSGDDSAYGRRELQRTGPRQFMVTVRTPYREDDRVSTRLTVWGLYVFLPVTGTPVMAYLDWLVGIARMGEDLARALPLRYDRRQTPMQMPLTGRYDMVDVFGTLEIPIAIGTVTKPVLFYVVPGSELFLGEDAISDFKLSLNPGTRTVRDDDNAVISRLPFPRYP